MVQIDVRLWILFVNFSVGLLQCLESRDWMVPSVVLVFFLFEGGSAKLFCLLFEVFGSLRM